MAKLRTTQKVLTWKQARKLVIERTSPCGTYAGPIDPGVNFFVLVLEHLGARTEYSCEGHPSGFYVLFSAPLAIAHRIVRAGYFRVELERGSRIPPRWSIRADFETEEDKNYALTLAAKAWQKEFEEFGALTVLNTKT
jgi:hypothetical protein